MLEREKYVHRLLQVMISPFIASIHTCTPEIHILRKAQKPVTVAPCNKCY